MFSGPRRAVDAVFRQRFGADFPTLKVRFTLRKTTQSNVQEISSNVAYVFTNTEPLIDFATPTLSRVIEIGGLGAKEPKELDEVVIKINLMRKTHKNDNTNRVLVLDIHHDTPAESRFDIVRILRKELPSSIRCQRWNSQG